MYKLAPPTEKDRTTLTIRIYIHSVGDPSPTTKPGDFYLLGDAITLAGTTPRVY